MGALFSRAFLTLPPHVVRTRKDSFGSTESALIQCGSTVNSDALALCEVRNTVRLNLICSLDAQEVTNHSVILCLHSKKLSFKGSEVKLCVLLPRLDGHAPPFRKVGCGNWLCLLVWEFLVIHLLTPFLLQCSLIRPLLSPSPTSANLLLHSHPNTFSCILCTDSRRYLSVQPNLQKAKECELGQKSRVEFSSKKVHDCNNISFFLLENICLKLGSIVNPPSKGTRLPCRMLLTDWAQTLPLPRDI